MSAVAPAVAPSWSSVAVERLLDAASCPACGARSVHEQRCRACGADFHEVGAELWDASQTAAAALRARQAVLDRVPRVPAAAARP
ncbi:MAG: hypothetical protein QM611_02970, partial [Microbacterium sp.]|uniref:hypothetical protein n=1 Tax=Microbacterium sp. TaxID=51671 RepID=UPI0039E71765